MGKRTILKILMGTHLSSNCSWSVSSNVCLSVPFFSTQCWFSSNRHGASSWTTRFSPRTKILKMTDLLERAMVVTVTIDFIFDVARTCAMVNNYFFPSCNFLGLSARDFSNYLEVCPASVLSVCLVVRPSFSRPCSCVLKPVSSTHRVLGDRFFDGGDLHDLTALACVLFSPIPVFSVDPAAVKEDGSVVTWGKIDPAAVKEDGSVVTWKTNDHEVSDGFSLSSNSSWSVSRNACLSLACRCPFSQRCVGFQATGMALLPGHPDSHREQRSWKWQTFTNAR